MELIKEKYRKIDCIIDQVISNMNINLPYCLEKADLKSAAWLNLIQNLDRYCEERGSFESYIWIITKRAIYRDLQRYNSYRWRDYKLTGKINFDRLDDVDVGYFDEGITRFEKSYLKEIITIAKRRLNRVSEKHLIYFELCYEQGMTAREIAEKVGDDIYRVVKIRDYSLRLFKREIESIKKWTGV